MLTREFLYFKLSFVPSFILFLNVKGVQYLYANFENERGLYHVMSHGFQIIMLY
jgi:hypothetical protein